MIKGPLAAQEDQHSQLEQQIGEQQKHAAGQPCQVVPSQTTCSASSAPGPEVDGCASDLWPHSLHFYSYRRYRRASECTEHYLSPSALVKLACCGLCSRGSRTLSDLLMVWSTLKVAILKTSLRRAQSTLCIRAYLGDEPAHFKWLHTASAIASNCLNPPVSISEQKSAHVNETIFRCKTQLLPNICCK